MFENWRTIRSEVIHIWKHLNIIKFSDWRYFRIQYFCSNYTISPLFLKFSSFTISYVISKSTKKCIKLSTDWDFYMTALFVSFYSRPVAIEYASFAHSSRPRRGCCGHNIDINRGHQRQYEQYGQYGQHRQHRNYGQYGQPRQDGQ